MTRRKGFLLKSRLIIPTFFVDSINGNDANDGTSSSTPLRTLSAVSSKLTSDTKFLYLKRGSVWQEQFDVPINGLSIKVYGDSGNPPIIDGAKAISGIWTQPDSGTYPNIWQVSYTRAQSATTGSAHVAIWSDGEVPRYASSLDNLQASGGYYVSDLTATSTILYIKSITDPNSNGVLYEASHRRYCINGHAQTLGAIKMGQKIDGPIELKRAIDHYNGYTGGKGGVASRLLIRDGHIHHTVTEGYLTEDCCYIGVIPSISSPSFAVAYTSDNPEGLSHIFRRCYAVMPTGVNRNPDGSAFYSHGTSTVSSLTIEQSCVQATSIGGADALSVIIRDCYSEENIGVMQVSSTTNVFDVDRVIARDLSQISYINGNLFLRRLVGSSTVTIDNCGYWGLKGNSIQLLGGVGDRPTVTNTVIAGTTLGEGVGGGTANITVNKCVTWCNGLMLNCASFQGDYNIYYWVGNNNVRSIINGTLYQNLIDWQTATGHDQNSVFCKSADQTSGNQYALWLGVSLGINNGPADGDWRINPGARVYNGSGTAFIGVFSDGNTPLTVAGIQEYWDFNLRLIVNGCPNKYPIFPKTANDMRTYITSPQSWNFYP